MEQFDQLLTCCICLDRYRNPKLLPCQHSFCMEPCMEGLINYVTRQLKCPECRAEHRVPYQGVQAYPTNVTLQRFLELHMDITGELPDPTAGQIMERCSVCTEKNYCTLCSHCDKKVCSDCKTAHLDILKREISRINNQIRRCAHRLQDSVGLVDKNLIHLQTNCSSVLEEIEETYRRLSKVLKDRMDYLKGEVETFLAKEMKNLNTFRENMEQEVSNIECNCELAEKYMTEGIEWDDNELMDTKDIFLRTMEFIRNFDYEPGDYTRRVRFSISHDCHQLSGTLSNLGDISMNSPPSFSVSGPPQPPALTPGLMRSKSDHRVAAQFRQAEEKYNMAYGEDRALSPRRQFGDRSGRSRHNQADDDDYGSGSDSRRTRFRSRFMRHLDSVDSDNEPSSRNVRFSDNEDKQKKEREKVIDTETVSKGPLSGVIRLFDSPRVMKRLQDMELKDKKKSEPAKPPPSAPMATPTQLSQPARKTARQQSEEDEIAKLKKQNKETTSGSETKPVLSSVTETSRRKASGQFVNTEEEGTRRSNPTTPTADRSRPSYSRQTSALERKEESVATSFASAASGTASAAESDDGSITASKPEISKQTSRTQLDSDSPKQRHSYAGSTTTSNLHSPTTTKPLSRASSGSSVNLGEEQKSGRSSRISRISVDRFKLKSASSSSTSTESSAASSPVRNTGAAFSTDELRSRFLANNSKKNVSIPPLSSVSRNTSDTETGYSRSRYGDKTPQSSACSVPSSRLGSTNTTGTSSAVTRAPFQSRFLGQAGTPSVEASKESESSSGESSDSGSESAEEGEEETPITSSSVKKEPEKESLRTDLGSLLARSAKARDTNTSYTTSKSESTTSPPFSRSRTLTSTTQSHSRHDTPTKNASSRFGDETTTTPSSRYGNDSISSSRYGNSTDNLTGSALSRSRTGSSLYSGREKDADKYPLTSKYLNRSRANLDDDTSASTYGSSRYSGSGYRSRFLNRSRSSAAIAQDEDGDEEPKSPSQTVPSIPSDEKYPSGRSRYAALKERRSRLARSKSSAEVVGDDNDGVKDGSVSYGKSREPSPEYNKEGEGSNLSNWARYLKNKYGSRKNQDSDAEQTKRIRKSSTLGGVSRTNSPGPDSDDETSTPFPISGPRHQYLQKRKVIMKVGQRGAEPGHFTWPRGVAVGPDGSIVVADSSNHRVQIFDGSGSFLKEFGHYGNGEGEFDCLAGVAVNRIGQFIIADRYNHRIQVFDPQGRFLRAFGSQGMTDGKFSYPWGITTDALGFIYVCDKENHRIQVFQSDGTFVGKFGSLGSKPGLLEHPHYIAVSNTNRVIVSDSNNHRIQIFDVNGKVISSFGAEGSDDGQFKFPRGVAVDEQGYIIVGDSGNNRIQIFTPDGHFLRAFGTWGSSDGEFKGLEGLAVTSNGSILVCDRENHRIQMF
ncbi:RING finger protein nhl-1-like isoform X2 [Artemia franciscana]|uniref:RING finger protein nhl-1-like isoform X2 n=1 Tax=Artemia franciscana TaxID=6661 RepID=UPI0032DA1739